MATEDSTPALPVNLELPMPPSPSPLRPPTLAPRELAVSHVGPSMPYLRLQGRWLEKAAFPVGIRVRVKVSARRLIVEPIDADGPLARAEPNGRCVAKNERPRPREWEWRATIKG
jgi:hypothetical protein